MRIRRGEYFAASRFGRATRHEELNVNRISIPILVIAVMLASSVVAFSQTSVFLYQGRLNDGGNPANGTYDMQFKLFDAISGGAQIGSTQTNASVTVSAGTFAVALDFGVNAFNGANRFLEVGVRPAGNPNPHTLLAPRTQILTAPYSIRSNTSATADLATNATTAATATNAQQLGGVAASEYVNNTNLPDKAIQNQTTLQANSNFNISGNGFFGNRAGIGTTTPLHRLGLSGGPAWTTHAWGGSVDTDNGSAIGWRANASGTRFGMGHSTDGFFMFRTISELGTATAAPIYDFKMDNAGNIGIGGVAINTDVSLARLNIFNLSLGYGFLNVLGPVAVGSYVDATGGWYGTRSNHPLHFFTNNGLQQMTLLPTGNFGIGTTNPTAKLQVVGGAAVGISASSQGNAVIGTSSGAGFASVFGENASGSTGYGVYGKSATGFGVYSEGHAGQSINKGGFVKASLYVLANGTIARCYNGITGSSTGNCGFSISATGTGSYAIGLGAAFDPPNRFYSLTTFGNTEYIVGRITGVGTNVTIQTFRTNETIPAGDVVSDFFLIVY